MSVCLISLEQCGRFFFKLPEFLALPATTLPGKAFSFHLYSSPYLHRWVSVSFHQLPFSPPSLHSTNLHSCWAFSFAFLSSSQCTHVTLCVLTWNITEVEQSRADVIVLALQRSINGAAANDRMAPVYWEPGHTTCTLYI